VSYQFPTCQYIRIDKIFKPADYCDMASRAKIAQLQIRVSAAQKSEILLSARRAGLDMSTYVLKRVLSDPVARFQQCIVAAAGAKSSFGLAELNSLLSGLSVEELRHAVAAGPEVTLTPFIANYVAAMVELACERRAIPVPRWTKLIAPLSDPSFGSALPSLRHYLLTHSPAAFRRRNIFIDSTLGSRV
jgi:hypothetical protein